MSSTPQSKKSFAAKLLFESFVLPGERGWCQLDRSPSRRAERRASPSRAAIPPDGQSGRLAIQDLVPDDENCCIVDDRAVLWHRREREPRQFVLAREGAGHWRGCGDGGRCRGGHRGKLAGEGAESRKCAWKHEHNRWIPSSADHDRPLAASRLLRTKDQVHNERAIGSISWGTYLNPTRSSLPIT